MVGVGEHRSKAEDGWDGGDEERKGEEEDGMPREEEKPSPGVDIMLVQERTLSSPSASGGGPMNQAKYCSKASSRSFHL